MNKAAAHQVTPSKEIRRGVLLVLSSPSGAGKSALSRLLLQNDKTITMSVSVTTRKRRPSEAEGLHYRFVSIEDFDAMRNRGQLLEWAEVHGNFYGTPREPVEQALKQGSDILFDIDVQGTIQLYETMRADVASVFILPPSIAELKRRLHKRAEDDEATIKRRMQTARTEISFWRDYDYVLINDDLDKTFNDLQSILLAERLKRERNPLIAQLTEKLENDLAKLI